MTVENSVLLQKVKELYARLQKAALTAEDIEAPSNVTFPDYSAVIKQLYEEPETFQTRFYCFIPIFDIFRAFRNPDTLVLDVGAHLGYSAIAMRRHGCSAKIVSIDAIPSNVLSLAQLKELEGEAYDYIHCAVGDSVGELRLYVPVMNGVGITAIASTGGTLSEHFAIHLAQQASSYPNVSKPGVDEPRIAILDIKSSTLDSLFEDRGEVERIVAIKMDLEGNEGPAVKGAEGIFRRSKPLLMVEGANRDPVVAEAMKSYGYFHCERYDGVLRVQQKTSMAQDGFWVHPDRVVNYRSLGIFEGELPESFQAREYASVVCVPRGIGLASVDIRVIPRADF